MPNIETKFNELINAVKQSQSPVKKFWWIFVLVAFCLLFGAGLIVYFCFIKKGSDYIVKPKIEVVNVDDPNNNEAHNKVAEKAVDKGNKALDKIDKILNRGTKK